MQQQHHHHLQPHRQCHIPAPIKDVHAILIAASAATFGIVEADFSPSCSAGTLLLLLVQFICTGR
jgi:hypothetical protein